jgi:hypothetical protein
MKSWKILVIVGLLLMGFSSAFAEYLPLRTDVTAEKPQTIVLRSDAQQVQLEILIPGIERSQAVLQGRNWDRIEIPGGGLSGQLGAPELATFSRLVAIPATAGVRVDMEILESETIPNVELMPAQGKDPVDLEREPQPVQFDMAAYATDGFYGLNEVAISEPALMRGVRLVAVQTSPVSYNPTTKELRVAHRYRVNIHFEGTDLRNVPTRALRPMSHSWAKIMRSTIANFDDLGVLEVPMGSYLIVCLNNADLQNRLAPLVEWKQRKGHYVSVQTFAAGASTTTIKNIIQSAYNSWEIPPEFVLLFGDSDGSYALPGYTGDAVDHQYTQLDGGDILSDVALGRLPVSSTAEVEMMVAKNLFYEKMPYTANSDWYHQGMVAAWLGDGISEKQVAQWIKTRFIEHGYTRVDTMWFSSFNATQWYAAMNAGMCYYEERSYWNYGVSSTNIGSSSLANGRMLPFVSNLTCGTGGFAGNSEMEYFVSVGTAATPKGAIGCVGTATLSTHTRFNNTITLGMFASLFVEDNPYAGEALVFGKLELYNAYQTHDAGNVTNFSNWNALAGDPGVDLFTHAIRYMTCTVPDNVTYGVNSLTLTVHEGSQPLAEATVCFYKDNDLQSVGNTDANGQITLPIGVATAGNVKVTITKHDFYPIVDSLNVVQENVAVGLQSFAVDDDNSGGSSGDNDGRVNPGETVQLPLVFKNFGNTVTATGIATTASGSDIFASLLDSTETFPDLAPGATGNSLGTFLVHIADNCPDGSTVRLNLANSSNQGNWIGLLDLPVVAYNLGILTAQASGGDTLLAPGETANLVLSVKNEGGKSATSLTATLTSLSSFVTVNDNSASFGTVNIGATANCSGNPFNLTAAGNTPPGQKADLRVVFTSSTGATQTDTLTLQLGPKAMTDTQGPDAYGYYCFDNTDVNYAQCPTYNWVDINSIGTQLSINDPTTDDDQSVNVNLPFTFRYYGQNVNTITVCSNGWLATHANPSFTDFRNYPIPSATGPNGMIAGFWDDLVTTSTGKVYTYNDVSNHRFIVCWSHMRNYSSSGVEEDFEIFLYDPAFTPTPTGDGEIVFQYSTVNESYGTSTDNPYSTVGIESPDSYDGIEVVYWNTYDDPAAAHLQNARAYKFTTAFTYGALPLNLDINLTPVNPPIVIPANGGSFNFNVAVVNNGPGQIIYSAWARVKNPNGSYTAPTLGPVSINTPVGLTVTRLRTQNIPSTWASGLYTYLGYVNNIFAYPAFDSSSFTFTKSAQADGGPLVWDALCGGELFDGEIATVSLPASMSLIGPTPNPFNPTTTISYQLAVLGHVSLRVYDTAGRLVTTLVDGNQDAGTHQVTFDGSKLSSGLYFVRMQAGDFSQVRKMMLIK